MEVTKWLKPSIMFDLQPPRHTSTLHFLEVPHAASDSRLRFQSELWQPAPRRVYEFPP
jgi:hypothetical protein